MMKFAGLIGLLFFTSSGFAQKTKDCKFEGIKIGDIQVSSELAKEYFVDLWINPDTVRICGYDCDEFAQMSITPRGENRVKKFGIKKIKDIIDNYGWERGKLWTVPREPSAIDFAHWMKLRKKR